jgi:hypothetical protein
MLDEAWALYAGVNQSCSPYLYAERRAAYAGTRKNCSISLVNEGMVEAANTIQVGQAGLLVTLYLREQTPEAVLIISGLLCMLQALLQGRRCQHAAPDQEALWQYVEVATNCCRCWMAVADRLLWMPLRTTGMCPMDSNPSNMPFLTPSCPSCPLQAGIDANNTKAIEAGQVAMTRLFVLTYLQGTLEYAFKMGLQVKNGPTSFPSAKKAQVGAPAGLAAHALYHTVPVDKHACHALCWRLRPWQGVCKNLGRHARSCQEFCACCGAELFVLAHSWPGCALPGRPA